ncbi:hypothetical protein ACFOVU_00325 [Nocardiopsis sediminis]|uniref:DUF892 family protein n=1 Tax=Nocardiopsis sediminis TaxID=1778267 RepID=A0ABV8FDY8_9ACTN
MYLDHYLTVLSRTETGLGKALVAVGRHHVDDSGLAHTCARMARECDDHVRSLDAFARRHLRSAAEDVEHAGVAPFAGPQGGRIGLLRDLHALYLLAADCEISWTIADRAAQSAGDAELAEVVARCHAETSGQVAWLRSRIREVAGAAVVATG